MKSNFNLNHFEEETLLDRIYSFFDKNISYFKITRLNMDSVYFSQLDGEPYAINRIEENLKENPKLWGWYEVTNPGNSVYFSMALAILSRPIRLAQIIKTSPVTNKKG